MGKKQFGGTQQENIQIDHINEQTWGKLEQLNTFNEENDRNNTQTTTHQEKLTTSKSVIQRTREITNVLLQDYTQKEVGNAIKALKTTRHMVQLAYHQKHTKQSKTGQQNQ